MVGLGPGCLEINDSERPVITPYDTVQPSPYEAAGFSPCEGDRRGLDPLIAKIDPPGRQARQDLAGVPTLEALLHLLINHIEDPRHGHAGPPEALDDLEVEATLAFFPEEREVRGAQFPDPITHAEVNHLLAWTLIWPQAQPGAVPDPAE